MTILPKEEIQDVYENTITGKISLDFANYNGFIQIHAWDNPRYRVEVNRWARALTSKEAKKIVENLKMNFSEIKEENGTTLVLEAEEKISTGTDIKVFLPQPLQSVHLSTVNGDIEGSVTADEIQIETTNGKIQGFYQGREVNLETVNGRVNAECGESREYSATTTNGDIDLLVKGGFRFDLRTTLGSITVVADDVTYTMEERDHKKGSTIEPQLTITASTTTSSITVMKK